MNQNITITEFCGAVRFERNASDYYTSKRDFAVLSYRKVGNSTFTMQGNTITAKSGDIIYIPSGVSYKQKNDKSEKLIAVHMKSEALKNGNLEVFSVGKNIAKLFDEIALEYEKLQNGYVTKCIKILYEILTELIKDQNNKDKVIPTKIEQAIRIMHENYSNSDVTVSYVADRVNISQSYLRQSFLKYCDSLPYNYLRNLRLTHAENLLSTKYYTIAKVAALCGYDDEKNFITSFKKQFGITPSKYRNSNHY